MLIAELNHYICACPINASPPHTPLISHSLHIIRIMALLCMFMEVPVIFLANFVYCVPTFVNMAESASGLTICVILKN